MRRRHREFKLKKEGVMKRFLSWLMVVMLFFGLAPKARAWQWSGGWGEDGVERLRLERILTEQPVGPVKLTNVLQHAIRAAVDQGVPADTIVLLLLFPLVAAIIAAFRHLVGIRGFGIFLPAVLSVVFVTTGIGEGLLLFLLILLVATGARLMLRKVRLQYLPRMALLLLFVSLGVLGLLFAAPRLGLGTVMNLSILPILVLILLTESFIGIQIGKSMKEAVRMTLETLVVALVCSFVLQLKALQRWVLLHPEAMVVGVVVFDLYVGKYTGLRLLEYKKFRELLK